MSDVALSVRDASHPGYANARGDGQGAHSSITKLHDDILLYIFLLNSRIDLLPPIKQQASYHYPNVVFNTKGALTSNRHSSQVCRRWRGITLSSSTLWANALEIHNLSQISDSWRDLVFERTGRALITLSGLVQYSNPNEGLPAVNFVLTILKEHWWRVKALSIGTGGEDILDHLRLVLKTPSPNLQHFSVITRWDAPAPFSHTGMLFSNDSPKLQSVYFSDLGCQFFGPWSRNMRQLWLTGGIAKFTFDQIYTALRDMPLLGSLFIDESRTISDAAENARVRYDHQYLQPLSLPRLVDITISSIESPSFLIDLLNLIVPARDCRLVITKPSRTELTKEEVRKLQNVYLSFMIKPASHFVGATYLSLEYTKIEGFNIRVGRNCPDSISISLRYTPKTYTTREHLVDFATPIFHALAANNVHMNSIPSLYLNIDDALLPATDPHLHLFIRGLSSVTTLRCTMSTLRLLSDAQDAVTHSDPHPHSTGSSSHSPLLLLLLPKLERLALVDVKPKQCLTRFLVRRLVKGAPVRYLDMPMGKCDETDEEGWKLLNGIDENLSIEWRLNKDGDDHGGSGDNVGHNHHESLNDEDHASGDDDEDSGFDSEQMDSD